MTGLSRIDLSHHAILIEGQYSDISDELVAMLEKTFAVEARGNPDFHVRTYETLSIDDARELKELASLRAGEGKAKIFVISFAAMGVEAQNALLKLFEEPTPHTHFFLITPRATRILPTLRSRLFVVAGDARRGKSAEAKRFLAATPAERLNSVKDIVEERDRAAAGALIEDLEDSLASDAVRYAHALAELERARGYLPNRASSVKLLLEHLAITLPTV